MPDIFVAISLLSCTPKAGQLPFFPSSSLFLFSSFFLLVLSRINVTLTFLFCRCLVFKLPSVFLNIAFLTNNSVLKDTRVNRDPPGILVAPQSSLSPGFQHLSVHEPRLFL